MGHVLRVLSGGAWCCGLRHRQPLPETRPQPRRALRQRRHRGCRAGRVRLARLPRATRSERAGSQSLRAWSQESVYWGSRRKKRRKGGEIYHKKSVKSAEFLHEKGGISIWPQLPSEATEASNENEFKTQSDVFLDGVRGTEQRPSPPGASPLTPPSQAAPQPHWAPLCSVRSPQSGPPLPSRSSQCYGQTHRSIRSTQ